MVTHEYFMQQALNLARLSEVQTRPNPQVGALIVKNDQIVGIGTHLFAGGSHAEIFALQQAGELARGATLYLTLDKQKVFPFRIEKNSPIKITFDPTKNDGEFVIGMSDSMFYESQEEELDIIIDHNFGTRNLNIQVFNIVSNEVDLKYPTYPNIEYPSDNQIKIYLSEPRRVHVVISK